MVWKNKELYEISKKEGLIDSDMSFEEFLGDTPWRYKT